jgi:hypothetical protein
MRAEEFSLKPHLYLDQDGVQADFFTAWAQWHNQKFGQDHVQRYKDIGDREQREQSISELNKEGPEFIEKFFATLPVLPGFARLLAWVTANDIPFTVLSAPLRNNEAASIQGKRTWLARHNPRGAAKPIFTSDKARLATQGGQPNVLVDDFKKYVQAWRDAGGIAILHRDNNVDETIRQLAEIYGAPVAESRDMRSHGARLKTYMIKLRLPQKGYQQHMDTTVQARSPEQARRIIRAQYGSRTVIVGQPRELK